MNFGVKSRDLLVELKRSDWLPPYNEDGVRGVLAEIQALYDELTDTLGGRTTVRETNQAVGSMITNKAGAASSGVVRVACESTFHGCYLWSLITRVFASFVVNKFLSTLLPNSRPNFARCFVRMISQIPSRLASWFITKHSCATNAAF